MNRYLVTVLILILVTAAGYLYLHNDQSFFHKDSAAYKAIPTSAPMFLEISSVKSISFSNSIIHELENAGIANTWFDFLHQADSLVGSVEKLPKNLLHSSFILTWGFTGRNQMIPLIIANAEPGTQQRSLEAFIEELLNPARYSYKKKKYGENTITEISNAFGNGPLFFSFTNELLLVSTRQILIEQVMLQMSTPGILKSPYFREVTRSSGSEGISLFINHERFEGFFGNILNRKSFERADEFGASVRFQPAAQASKFRDYAAWSELNLRFRDDKVLMSGITTADDSLNHFLPVFSDQQPVRSVASELLPANTSFFCSYVLSDKKSFFDRLEDFFSHSENFYHREERMKRFDMGVRSNIRNQFMQILNNEVIVSAGTIPVNPANKTVYFIMNTNGRSAAEDMFKKLITAYALRLEKEPDDFMSEFSVDQELVFPIYKFPFPSFPGLWLGSPFTMAEARYFTFHNNYLVASNTEEGLHEYIRNMVLGTTLSKDQRYQRFNANLLSKANINVFTDVNRIFSYRTEVLSDQLLRPVTEQEEIIRKFGLISWQVQNERSAFKNSLAISFQLEPDDQAKTMWQSVIGNSMGTKPYIFDNHTDRSSRDILFQDSQNQLHQVTGTGRVRWSLPLQEPILSEIHQVDVYRNERFQYFFNTKEKLYLIDRNGNHVSPFPVKLASAATNGINVFDYDKNRNYRFFVAGEDHKIYVYDQSGKPVGGWNFGQTDQIVTTPVQHCRVDGKDYIYFKDKGNIYILDRQGEPRVSIAARFEHSKNPVFFIPGSKPKLACTDKYGKVYFIYFNGTVEEKNSARFSENHFFTLDDLNGDNLLEFIYADGNEVMVLNEKGKKVFSRKFNNPISHSPAIYTLAENQKKVGVTEVGTNRIFLINADGKLHEGFPLQGNSGFSIGKLSVNSDPLNLVVGSESGMLFNYSLNQ